jgi:hypothetical protein
MGYIFTEGDVFKELMHDAGKFKICRVGWWAKNLTEELMYFKSDGLLLENFVILHGVSLLLFSGLQLIGWDHPQCGNVLSSMYTDLSVNFIQKYPQKHPESCLTIYLDIMVQSSWHTCHYLLSW